MTCMRGPDVWNHTLQNLVDGEKNTAIDAATCAETGDFDAMPESAYHLLPSTCNL